MIICADRAARKKVAAVGDHCLLLIGVPSDHTAGMTGNKGSGVARNACRACEVGWLGAEQGSVQSSDNKARCAGPFSARRGCADAFPHRYSSSSLQRFPLPSASSPRSTAPLQPPYTTPQHDEFLQELAVSLTLIPSTLLTISSKYPRQWPRISTSHQMDC
jgi:hypothetical protein